MANGIGYLIDILRSSDDQQQGISARQFTEAIRAGIISEPERFPELVQEYELRIRRCYPEWSSEKVRSRTLENIAGYVVMADHDYETEMVVRAATGGPRSAKEYFDNPALYGSAMRALATYVGVEGPALRTFLLEQQGID